MRPLTKVVGVDVNPSLEAALDASRTGSAYLPESRQVANRAVSAPTSFAYCFRAEVSRARSS
jgi:hypothetical protein